MLNFVYICLLKQREMRITKRPLPINEEIPLDPFRTIMSKTDKKGIIEYANDYFVDICQYKEWELMGQPHNIIRHPDMPKIMFKILWDRLFEGKNIHAVVKNLAKSGKYYWVVTDFQITYNPDGSIKALYSRRKAIPNHVKLFFDDLYKELIKIEEKGGMEASGAYLQAFLEDKNTTYDEFILNLFNLSHKDFMAYMTAEISDEELLGKEYYTAEEAIKKTKKKKSFLSKLFG